MTAFMQLASNAFNYELTVDAVGGWIDQEFAHPAKQSKQIGHPVLWTSDAALLQKMIDYMANMAQMSRKKNESLEY